MLRECLPAGRPYTSIDQHDDAFEVTTFLMRADLTGLDYNMPVED